MGDIPSFLLRMGQTSGSMLVAMKPYVVSRRKTQLQALGPLEAGAAVSGEQMLGGRPTEADVAARAAKIVTYTLDCMRGSILLSSNAADLLGIRPGSSLDEWRRLIIADDQERIERAMKNIAPAAPSYEIEYRMTNAATGRTVWVLDRGEAEFDGKGRLIFLRGAAIDLGTRASMEGEFRQSAPLSSRRRAWRPGISTLSLAALLSRMN